MYNFANLVTSKKDIVGKRSGNADTACSEGVKILELYKIKPNIAMLEQACKKFIEALEYNNEHVPSFLYTSYVFYALGNEEMAMKFFRMAEKLVPELNPDILNLKNQIQKEFSQNIHN